MPFAQELSSALFHSGDSISNSVVLEKYGNFSTSSGSSFLLTRVLDAGDSSIRISHMKSPILGVENGHIPAISYGLS